MPYLCDPCRVHQHENGICPKCGQALKFTLLPPPGEEPKPVPDAPTEFKQRYGNNPHATRNYAQDHVQSAFWSGLGKTVVIVFATIIGVMVAIYLFIRNMP